MPMRRSGFSGELFPESQTTGLAYMFSGRTILPRLHVTAGACINQPL